MTQFKDDKGAALVSVMLLVGVMSVGLVLTLETVSNGARAVGLSSAHAQAREYALAGEMAGAERIRSLVRSRDYMAMLDPESGNVLSLEVPVEGGVIYGEIEEQTNCLNLAGLVSRNDAGLYSANELAVEQFARLLKNLGLGASAAEALAASIADWQDSDGRTLPSGTENIAYSALDVPYLTPSSPLVAIDEIRLIAGMTDELYNVLRPLICLDNLTMDTRLNLNSIEAAKAPLLAAVLENQVSVAESLALINQRPLGGFDHVSTFWLDDALKDLVLDSASREAITLTPMRYKVSVEVAWQEASAGMTSLFLVSEDGSYSLISRRLGK